MGVDVNMIDEIQKRIAEKYRNPPPKEGIVEVLVDVIARQLDLEEIVTDHIPAPSAPPEEELPAYEHAKVIGNFIRLTNPPEGITHLIYFTLGANYDIPVYSDSEQRQIHNYYGKVKNKIEDSELNRGITSLSDLFENDTAVFLNYSGDEISDAGLTDNIGRGCTAYVHTVVIDKNHPLANQPDRVKELVENAYKTATDKEDILEAIVAVTNLFRAAIDHSKVTNPKLVNYLEALMNKEAWSGKGG